MTSNKFTIAIDFGSSFIKAALYNKNNKSVRKIIFNQPRTDLFANMVYVPSDDNHSTIFGSYAYDMDEIDSNGIAENFLKEEALTLRNRKKVLRKDLLKSFFGELKQQLATINELLIFDCDLSITTCNDDIVLASEIKKAAEACGFDKIFFIPFYLAIRNYWYFTNDMTSKKHIENLLIIDIGHLETRVRLLSIVDGSFRLNNAFDNLEVNFSGCFFYEKLLQFYLNASEVDIENDDHIDLMRNFDKIVKEVSSNHTGAVFCHGKQFLIDTHVLEVVSRNCDLEFQEQFFNFIYALKEHINLDKTELIVCGMAMENPIISKSLKNRFKGNLFNTNQSAFIAVFGAALPNNLPFLKESNSTYQIELHPNTVFSEYTLIEEIGEGGMGTVWKAIHNTMKTVVAIKFLKNNDFMCRESAINQFLEEVRNTASLKHINIIQTFNAGYLNGHYYMVTEFIDGDELSEILLRRHIIGEKETIEIAMQICNGLNHAWKERRILHRDIKPDNIMIDKDGIIKIMDLGIAVQLGESLKTEKRVKEYLLGTAQYVSPEQILNETMDCRTDIYSLGIIMYEMLTGVVPFAGENSEEILKKQIKNTPIAPKDYQPNLSDETNDMICKMLEKKQSTRYLNWDELSKDLNYIFNLITDNNSLSVANDDLSENEDDDNESKNLMTIIIFLLILFIVVWIKFVKS